MKTLKFLRNSFTLAIVASLFVTGCQKEVDELQPLPQSEQSGSVLKATATGKILSYVVNGDYRTGLICNLSNTVTLKINVYTLGFYNIISNSANGIQFSKSGEFRLKGIQDVILYGNGTPLVTGASTYSVSFGGYGCTFKVVTVSNTPIIQTSCNTSYTYMQVANHKTEKVWLDKNLGATRVALSATDHLGYGSLFQWGRLNDGHQCINWTNASVGIGMNGTTSTLSPTNTPGHSMYIKAMNTASDWRSTSTNTLWQGVTGLNNPCPTGYRIPTAAEMTAESASWSTKNTAGAFGSSLHWAVAGYREFYDGVVYDAGLLGGVWTSTVSNSKSKVLWISTTEAITTDDFRAEGYSVRCIKN
jgi:hypothetical protein